MFFCLVIILTFSLTTTTANITALNILPNSGFTSWSGGEPDDWTVWLGGTMTITDETVDVQDGDGHAVEATGATSSGDYCQLRQTVTSEFTANDDATFTTWYKQSIDCQIQIFIYWIANNGSQVDNLGQGDVGGITGIWTKLSVNLPVPTYPEPITQALVIINLSSAEGATVLFDNATFGGDIELINEFNSDLVPIIVVIAPMIIATTIIRKKKA